MFLTVGSYVRLKRYPQTHIGTITGGSMHEGAVRYVFHLDERISISFPDTSVYETDIESCERPSDEEIARINELLKATAASNPNDPTQPRRIL